jgi:uncharacterized membrane protein
MNPDFWINFLKIAVIVSILDFIWIGGYLLDHFKPMIQRVQKEPMVTNPHKVVIAYIILIALITILIPKCESIGEAFIIGLLTYGVYDSTNYATLKDWDPSIALVDSLWGGVLFASTYYIMISP